MKKTWEGPTSCHVCESGVIFSVETVWGGSPNFSVMLTDTRYPPPPLQEPLGRIRWRYESISLSLHSLITKWESGSVRPQTQHHWSGQSYHEEMIQFSYWMNSSKHLYHHSILLVNIESVRRYPLRALPRYIYIYIYITWSCGRWQAWILPSILFSS